MAKDKFAEYRKHRRSAMRQSLLSKENGVIAVLGLAVIVVWIFALLHYFSTTAVETGRSDAPDATAAPAVYEAPDELQVVFFDVGQGNSVGIFTPAGNVILYDGGEGSSEYRDSRYTRAFDAGNKVILPYCRERGIRELAAVILSHAHSDHYGGLLDVCRLLDVKNFYDPGAPCGSFGYRNLLQLLLNKGINYITPEPGEILELDPDLQIKVLAVDPHQENLNNTSIVLRLVYNEVSFLLTGDAEAPVEQKLLAEYGDALRSDVLQVGHHGSKTSSTERFVAAVRPSYAIIPVGDYNKYGHPNSEVLERYEAAGSDVLRTDQNGTITVSTSGRAGDIDVAAER